MTSTTKRIIAKLDIKNQFVIKGISFDGLRKVGDPKEMAVQYYQNGIDEIIFSDAVASYYDRNSLFEIINDSCKQVFVPIIIEGGLRKIEDIEHSFKSGADKVGINTQATKTPAIITDAANKYGAQAIVSSIVAKNHAPNKWEVYTGNGREPTGMDVMDWAVRCQELGAGELFVTSIDKDGTKKGFDIELFKSIKKLVDIPLLACGGAGNIEDVIKLLDSVDVDGIVLAASLHYKIIDINQLKKRVLQAGFKVRL